MITKVRQSNMELLRIIAMFLVLLVHVDFFSLGSPTASDCINEPTESFFRVFFEAISIACVDIFICISGWFGIKPTIKGFSNFVFQCLFWLIGLYVVTLAFGTSELSFAGIKGCFALTQLNWFIKAYILLYILSPVLNAFVAKASKNEFRNVLIGFFIFEFIYGWVFSGSTSHIQSGYSTISFIGLYLLARYVRIHQPKLSLMPRHYYGIALGIMSVCLSIIYITPPILGLNHIIFGSIWFSYISPYCICYAMMMVLYFSKLKIQSKAINWIAASSFAVFLIHTNPNTLWYFRDYVNSMYNHLGYSLFWPWACIFMIIIFLVAVLIDQVRVVLWKQLWNYIERKI